MTKNCPRFGKDNNQSVTSNLIITKPAQKNGAARRLQRQKEELADKLGRKVSWQKGNDYNISLVNDLIPIGPEDEEEKTLVIDTEGLTVNGTLCRYLWQVIFILEKEELDQYGALTSKHLSIVT